MVWTMTVKAAVNLCPVARHFCPEGICLLTCSC